MSTPDEKLEAIRHAVAVAERRLADLNALPRAHTKAETYERDMTIECIRRGRALLDPTPRASGKRK